MNLFHKLLQLPPALFLTALILPSPTLAKPAVDVALQSSFPTPPFQLELLESAAAENASSFFPLLDALTAADPPLHSLTDEEQYRYFELELKLGNHIVDPAALSSWKLTLATRASVPRIEAQYQFWRSSVQRRARGNHVGDTSPSIVTFKDGRLCQTLACSEHSGASEAEDFHHSLRNLKFDRVDEVSSQDPSLTVYIDPSSPDFPDTWRQWRQIHRRDSVRLRYMPSPTASSKPLTVNGYGAELALKRTDYIVIDDRESDEREPSPDSRADAEVRLDDDETADLKPLSSSELRHLSLNTASFIMSSESPWDTLLKVSQDFPKHAAALSLHNATKPFLKEHRENRDVYLPAGYNVLWMNGQQIGPREVDAFNLLDIIRRERRLVNSIRSLGLSASEAISLLSHPEIAKSQTAGEPQRYDFRDDTEDGQVIIWLNDIEKDKRYADWSGSIQSFLQMMFPGQLPTVRKDTHNIVYPLRISERKDIEEVVESLQTLVKRKVPVRIGLVPIVTGEDSAGHAKVLYYLLQNYGLAAVIKYLELLVKGRQVPRPSHSTFNEVLEKSRLRPSGNMQDFASVLESEELQNRIEQTLSYLRRLGIAGSEKSLFANGVPLTKDESWMQAVSQQLSLDLRVVQQNVFEGSISQDTWIPGLFLNRSSLYRNPVLIPEEDKDVKIFDLHQLQSEHALLFSHLKPFQMSESEDFAQRTSILLLADLNTEQGAQLVLNATEFAERHPELDMRFLHQTRAGASRAETDLTPESMARIHDILQMERPHLSSGYRDAMGRYLTGVLMSQSATVNPQRLGHNPLAREIGLKPGESGILVNGRLIGPLPQPSCITQDDFEALLGYERKKRVAPVETALRDLRVVERLEDPLSTAKLSAIVALSTTSDIPEGIFDSTPGPRTSLFKEWDTSHTSITAGSHEKCVIELVASIDPASGIGQRWTPILNVLAKLDGICVRIFLNPKSKLEELPVKRFYRHVLEPSPKFDANGKLESLRAHFAGIPEEALLTMSLDVPPSWLVAPRESIHDLDNVRLSSFRGTGVTAIYELENILIEGHTRDTSVSSPPRGAQLVLGTEADPSYAGTIIMANLGYFQFKANPGVYNLGLQTGASQQIFSIDSAGPQGWTPQPGDETTEISLVGFRGLTLFPRLSRRPGREFDEVLESSTSSAENLVHKGAEIADSLLSQVGLANVKASDYVAKGFDLGQKVLSKTGMQGAPPSKQKHADINIFSVASGHLYERMLNIMILSVMRNTDRSVKFWFVEQFLSPSFKSFLPSMAARYGFSYEMVAFKWPHWLRAQTEKQRTIWGYKILFLDVLFPLDLDKVIFVDADQIVRTDMYSLVQHDLQGAPYGFTPMCDSRTEMEGFRFWKQGYWANFLRGMPYHISALYVVDLKRFRAMAAGDRLRGQYQTLSADPNSLSNLDQDLPNHMQMMLPIHSLPQDWLWCETWCSDEALKTAKTIDLCNNPQTKEPKLDRARRQVPEWTEYDEEIAALARKSREKAPVGDEQVADLTGQSPPTEIPEKPSASPSRKDEL